MRKGPGSAYDKIILQDKLAVWNYKTVLQVNKKQTISTESNRISTVFRCRISTFVRECKTNAICQWNKTILTNREQVVPWQISEKQSTAKFVNWDSTLFKFAVLSRSILQANQLVEPLVEQELPSLPEPLSLPPGFWWGSCFSIFSFMCIFCRSLFVLLSFFFWPLYCLFFFDIRNVITSLVSSNSSYILYFDSANW